MSATQHEAFWGQLTARGSCGTIDRELARTLGRLGGEDDPWVQGAVAVLHSHVMRGHVCVRLGELATALAVDTTDLGQRVSKSSLVSHELAQTPLVLDGDRLYLERHAAAERFIAEWVRARAARTEPVGDVEACRQAVELVFGASTELDWQRVAVALALQRSFVVLAGGPGTGKTTTVVRLLAAAFEVARRRGAKLPRVLLMAPTGKAAARLRESVQRAAQELANKLTPELLAALPNDAATVHRALGRGFDGKPRRDGERPLEADLVVLDEASMIDVELLAQLLDAVPPTCRLVMLGDPRQLASVEVGAVLGDLCGLGVAGREVLSTAFSTQVADVVTQIVGGALPDAARTSRPSTMSDSLVVLTRVHRTSATGGVAELSRAIDAGDVAAAMTLLASRIEGVRWVDPRETRLQAVLDELAVSRHRECLDATDPLARLQALERFRTLTAHREGASGAAGVNTAIEARLVQTGAVSRQGSWYPGRPVMVLENDYELGLFNGDVGLVEEGRMAAFREGAEGVRLVHAVRLPAHETAYALTIHKSQGSEFEDVLVVLPTGDSRVLTRELVYTAVTRAKKSVTLVAAPEVLQRALARRIRRGSGLGELLWQTS